MSFILAIILLLLAIGGVVARKTYFYLPARELKRQAERKDPLASQLYRAAAYGNSLKAILWLYIGLTTAGSIIVMARELPVLVSLFIVGPVLWVAFSLIPATRLTRPGVRLTMLVTPTLTLLLNYLHPLLSRAADLVQKRYTIGEHTKLYEKDDLLDLIERQQRQADNRLRAEELEIARRALTFEDFTVGDILTPRKQVKTVLATDTVGPILIDELHKSGQDFVLVRDKPKGMVIGSLEFRRLGIDSKGQVKDLMNPTVYYVHENDSLSEALHAFFTTNHPLFIVVNSFEEFVGIVSVENILQHLMGHMPGDDFDQYADMKAVASRHPRAEKPKKHEEKIEDQDETPVETDEKVVE